MKLHLKVPMNTNSFLQMGSKIRVSVSCSRGRGRVSTLVTRLIANAASFLGGGTFYFIFLNIFY